MIDRNRKLKMRPERFQDSNPNFNLVFTVEERIFDIVTEYLSTRENANNDSEMYVINVDVEDTYDSATVGATIIGNIMEKLSLCNDLENEIEEVLTKMQQKIKKPILFTMIMN
ncbi:MAG: RNA polymerase II subunit A C-terminal domain phosphatase [Paramarteilia canceri]